MSPNALQQFTLLKFLLKFVNTLNYILSFSLILSYRPNYRFPFYDHKGNGELLYGYGQQKLFPYTVFRPVEGYLR